MARLDELDLDDESEEERSLEEQVKAQGGGSSATPSAAAAAAAAGKGGDGGVGDGDGEGEDGDGDGSVVDPRRAAAGEDGQDKPKKRRPRFTEDHIIGANGGLGSYGVLKTTDWLTEPLHPHTRARTHTQGLSASTRPSRPSAASAGRATR